MALNQEIWRKYILDQLKKDSSFIMKSYRVDESNIVSGKIVHVPNAGARPNVTRNRTQFPATVVTRADADVVYLLDQYTTDPINITDIEKVELSYDKIASVLSSHVSILDETLGDWMAFNWLSNNTSTSAMTAAAFAAGTFVATAGSAGTGNGPNSQGLKKCTSAALRSARLIMNKLSVPKERRWCILPSIMYDELLEELATGTVANVELLKGANLPDGALMKLFGFNIMERSSVALMTKSTPTVIEPGTAETSSHGYAGFCWQEDMVESAIGEIKMFENRDDPTYYGDIYSALVRGGGRARWADSKGVVPIVQTS